MGLKDVALLLLRISGILLAVNHGWGKIASLTSGEGTRFMSGLGEMGFPMPGVFAWAAALSEMLGGALVAVGLFTRIAAPFAAFTMFVAAFLRHKAHLQVVSALGIAPLTEEAVKKLGNPELASLYFFVFFALAALGPGRISLDHILRGKGGRTARSS